MNRVIIPVTEMSRYEYRVNPINTRKQLWNEQKTFNCIGEPKEKELMIFLNKCSLTYTTASGEIIKANSGDVVYTPVGSEYLMNVDDIDANDGYTIGVNFYLYRDDNVRFSMSDGIYVFKPENENRFLSVFERLLRVGSAAMVSRERFKASFYELMYVLLTSAKFERIPARFSAIYKGLLYLEEHSAQTMSVGELADMCRISEVYFRKLFVEYTGMSPLRYRQMSRITMAKDFLEETDMNIGEIAETLGFYDAAHFSRVFKQFTGVSPKDYSGKE